MDFCRSQGWLASSRFAARLKPLVKNRLHALTRVSGEQTAQAGVNAFHEKAGRSQVDSLLFFMDKGFFSRRVATVAMLPSALSRSDGFARCMLGVLGSAGAAICLAPCRFTEVERRPGD